MTQCLLTFMRRGNGAHVIETPNYLSVEGQPTQTAGTLVL